MSVIDQPATSCYGQLFLVPVPHLAYYLARPRELAYHANREIVPAHRGLITRRKPSTAHFPDSGLQFEHQSRDESCSGLVVPLSYQLCRRRNMRNFRPLPLRWSRYLTFSWSAPGLGKKDTLGGYAFIMTSIYPGLSVPCGI